MKLMHERDISELLEEFEARTGCIAGVCTAESLDEQTIERLSTSAPPFVSRDASKRADPQEYMLDVQSIIVIGMFHSDSERMLPDVKGHGTDAAHGNDEYKIFCAMAAVRDYHITVKERLQEIYEAISSRLGLRPRSLMMVDNGPLAEKPFAERARLGFVGKHGILISRYGSYFNIGLLLLDVRLVDNRSARHQRSVCNTCGRCISACPGNAISPDGYKIDYERCISYITQKKNLTQDQIDLKGQWAYGCDICQEVCPRNDPSVNPSAKRPTKGYIRAGEIEAYRDIIKQTAAGWRLNNIV